MSRLVTAKEPVTCFSRRTTSNPDRSVGSSWRPSQTTSPPGRAAVMAARRVIAAPTASTTTSAPRPPEASRAAAATSAFCAFTVRSAPSRFAMARRVSDTSETSTRIAPLAFRTCSTNRPMVPAPNTTTVPGNRCCVSRSAWTAFPRGSASEACSGVTSFGSGINVETGTATRSANAPGRFVPKTSPVRQSWTSPSRQYSQRPHAIWELATTRSPIRHSVTPWPTSTTSPLNSCPIIKGGVRRAACATNPCVSDPQIPAARTWRTTSPVLGVGSGTSRISS